MRDIQKVSRQDDVNRLRQLWDAGKASGPAAPFDSELTIAAAQARLKEAAPCRRDR
jgi:antitoxin ParD1/3/4